MRVKRTQAASCFMCMTGTVLEDHAKDKTYLVRWDDGSKSLIVKDDVKRIES